MVQNQVEVTAQRGDHLPNIIIDVVTVSIGKAIQGPYLVVVEDISHLPPKIKCLWGP